MVFSACKKSDEKIEKMIVGTWEVKCAPVPFWGGYDCPSQDYYLLQFNEDGTVLFSNGGDTTNNDYVNVTNYSIQNMTILHQLTVSRAFAPDTAIDAVVKIQKINRRKMILIFPSPTGVDSKQFTYIKN